MLMYLILNLTNYSLSVMQIYITKMMLLKMILQKYKINLTGWSRIYYLGNIF